MSLSIGEEKAKFSTARMMLSMQPRRSLLRSSVATATLACMLLPAAPGYGWGHEGHRIIADIASDHLTEATLEKLEPFLGDNDLASVANWADEVRHSRPETGPWHYVNIAPNSGGYKLSDCPDDNCIVAQITKFARILGDTTQPFEARTEALKFVVHFVGDISQPMHAMADAKGGNGIAVTAFGATQCGKYPCNLHSVWDTELITHSGVRERRYTRQLERLIAAKHLKAGPQDPAVWANGSLKLAEQAWVQPDTDIDEAYYLREKPVVDRQLALAGLRLARMLNEELGGVGNRRPERYRPKACQQYSEAGSRAARIVGAGRYQSMSLLSCSVSGHDFSRAVQRTEHPGFSPCWSVSRTNLDAHIRRKAECIRG